MFLQFGGIFLNIKFYEVDSNYINYLAQFEPRLFHNKQANQQNERKYIGILLKINGFNYFAPLSSFKTKHCNMKESLDFIKIGNYAVLNLNNMFPALSKYCQYVDFDKVPDEQYKKLLYSEYRIIKVKQEKILKNSSTLYNYKINNKEETPLAQRCNDFLLLESKAKIYK